MKHVVRCSLPSTSFQELDLSQMELWKVKWQQLCIKFLLYTNKHINTDDMQLSHHTTLCASCSFLPVGTHLLHWGIPLEQWARKYFPSEAMPAHKSLVQTTVLHHKLSIHHQHRVPPPREMPLATRAGSQPAAAAWAVLSSLKNLQQKCSGTERCSHCSPPHIPATSGCSHG